MHKLGVELYSLNIYLVISVRVYIANVFKTVFVFAFILYSIGYHCIFYIQW